MPIYEYECLECGAHFDRLQHFGDPQPKTCPNGHPRVHRLLSQPTIIFKGSGFYVTDNGRPAGSSRNGRKAKKSESVSEAEKQTKT
jgi:putative FmdB family regulatory protein